MTNPISEIDPLTASDWIHNLADALVQLFEDYIKSPGSDPERLALFTSFSSTKTAFYILHLCPKVVSLIGNILLELRLYYDSIWQLYFLSKYPSESDREKTSYLYAWVQLKQSGLWFNVFENNKPLESLLGLVEKGHSYSNVKGATERYILGTLSREYENHIRKYRPYFSSEIKSNEFIYLISATLHYRILSLINSHGISISELDNLKLLKIIYNDSAESMKFKLLAQFDLKNYKNLILPSDAYEK